MRKNIKKTFLVLLLLTCSICSSKAQFYSLGTNLLADVSTNLNVEFSLTLNRQWSLHMPIQYNPFILSSERKQIRNFTLTPGCRYWYRESYTGYFTGLQAIYSHYSIGGIWDDYRYAGDAYGAGISFGRAYAISKKWNWEWELGVGCVYTPYSKYICTHCGRKISDEKKILVVPSKLAVRLIYLF